MEQRIGRGGEKEIRRNQITATDIQAADQSFEKVLSEANNSPLQGSLERMYRDNPHLSSTTRESLIKIDESFDVSK